MIWYIMHLGPRDHVGQDQFESVKLLDTQNRSRQLRLNHMCNIFHSLGPSYCNQFFTKISDIHSHATRSSSFNFHIPRVGSYAKHSCFYQATLGWNNLPLHIKSISDKCSLSLPWRSTLLEMPGWFMSLLRLLNFLAPPPLFPLFVLFFFSFRAPVCLFVGPHWN